MSSSNRSNPAATNVKQEPPARIPSPTSSCVTVNTSMNPFKSQRPSSPTPSCSTTVLFGGRERGSISIRPLSAIVDQEDQMSTVGRIAPPPPVLSDLKLEQAALRLRPTPEIVPITDINDWRCSIKNVGDRIKYIFENDDKYQDVIFQVEGKTSTQQFKAHKLILRIASPVFDTMFQEADRSMQQSKQIFIPLKSVEPNTFHQMLKFIYTDEVDTGFDEQEGIFLLQAAKTYGVRQLYLECVNLLKNCMSNNVAVKLCEVATSYGDENLLDIALDHIANKAFEIFPSEAFLQLAQETLYKLFIRNDLRIDEESLFESAVRWGENVCVQQGLSRTSENLRKVLERLIPEIRFPLFSLEIYTLLVIPTKILTLEEQVGIYQYLSVDTTKQNKLPPISFKTTPRRSKKYLDLESNSSSDYREDSPASPLSIQNPSSLPNTELISTTEADSETASNISVYSDSVEKSRKLDRSVSNSSEPTKKRRKIDKKAGHRKSLEKASEPFNFEELFGNDTKCIELVNERAVSLNNFILQCSRMDYRDKIESIKLENVTIEDARKLDSRKVNFPRLKTFELNITIEGSISSIISEDSFALEKYLFFHTSKHEAWSYDKLWQTGIDITVTINKVIVLRISHENNHVVLNKFNGAPSVLKSLKEQPIKSIVYSHILFKDKNFPRCLNRIVILGVVSSRCMSSFIQQFRHLKELTVVSPAAGNVRALTLDTEFASKDKIRKLGLGNFKLHLEPTIRFYNITTLTLWRVTWESYFEEKFHHTFPKLETLCLSGPAKGTPKLLKNVFKIGTLTDLVSWNCDFQFSDTDGYDVKNFLRECGLAEPEKSFVLKRKSDKSGWLGSKMTYTELNRNMYKRLEYNYLYEDIKTFMNTS